MSRLLPLVAGNLRRGRRSLALSAIGILVGTGMFTFFLSLTTGIRQNVLNRLYPVNQIEVEPRSVTFLGLKEHAQQDLVIDDDLLARVAALPGVRGVYPKQRSKFQARLWGGADLFGRELHLEAFFDGVDAELLHQELREFEGVETRRVRERYRHAWACTYDADCRAEEACVDGTCRRLEHWRAFRDPGQHAWCNDDGHCAPGLTCVAGACARACGPEAPCGMGEVCAQGACAPTCARDGACAPGLRCEQGACLRLACRLARADDQVGELARTRGSLVQDPDRPCPLGTYCAARSVTSVEGTCEEPLPALLSPFLVTIYNSTAAVALGVPRIDGVELILGLPFRILYGNSFFARDEAPDQQVVRQAVIRGFSTKALEMGVTFPLPVVERINARFRGSEAARRHDSLIVETAGNEDIPAVVARLKDLGFELDEKSESAQKAGSMLFILSALFAFIALVILGVAAITISNTFLLLVLQRRREIGVLRAVGATRAHVRTIFLAESAAVGLGGALIGNGLAWAAARGLDALALRYFQGLAFLPERFFSFSATHVLASVCLGLAFAVLGASIPANRAARVDPAVALRGE